MTTSEELRDELRARLGAAQALLGSGRRRWWRKSLMTRRQLREFEQAVQACYVLRDRIARYQAVEDSVALLEQAYDEAGVPGAVVTDDAVKALDALESQNQALQEENERLQRFLDADIPGRCRDCPGGKSWEDEAKALQERAEKGMRG
jgi:hypothetical protein